MSDHSHRDHAHGGPNSDGLHHAHRPYWKRAHHDWRFWVAAFLIFAVMIFYVVTVEFSLVPGHQPPAPGLSPAGK